MQPPNPRVTCTQTRSSSSLCRSWKLTRRCDMQQVSDAFKAELVKSHVVYSYVDVVNPSGQTTRLTATGGSVQVDRTSDTRRRCSIDCVDPTGDLTPKNAASLLTPYGTEIR